MNLYQLCLYADKMEKQQEEKPAPAEQQLTLKEAIEADSIIGEMERKRELPNPFMKNGMVNWSLLFEADKYAADHPEVF